MNEYRSKRSSEIGSKYSKKSSEYHDNNVSIEIGKKHVWGWSGRAMVLSDFQCLGVLHIWIMR